MHPSGTHVLGLADLILPDPRFFLLFPVATNNKVLSQHLNFAADTVECCRVGWMWPLPLRRLAMCYWEDLGSCWICILQTKEQRVQTQLSQKNSWTTTKCLNVHFELELTLLQLRAD